MKKKLKALVIEKTSKDWGMVNMTELTTDGKWILGMNLITSIEEVIKTSIEKGVPIITREVLEKLNKKEQK